MSPRPVRPWSAGTASRGCSLPSEIKTLPEGLASLPAVAGQRGSQLRTDILRARDDLQQRLAAKAVDVGLAEGLKSPDPAVRRLSVFSLAALDDVSTVMEQLDQEASPELRGGAVEALRNWIAAGRDHDYKLFDMLKSKYRTAEAESILTLLHDFSPKELMNPDTYDLLINYLNHPQPADPGTGAAPRGLRARGQQEDQIQCLGRPGDPPASPGGVASPHPAQPVAADAEEVGRLNPLLTGTRLPESGAEILTYAGSSP